MKFIVTINLKYTTILIITILSFSFSMLRNLFFDQHYQRAGFCCRGKKF